MCIHTWMSFYFSNFCPCFDITCRWWSQLTSATTHSTMASAKATLTDAPYPVTVCHFLGSKTHSLARQAAKPTCRPQTDANKLSTGVWLKIKPLVGPQMPFHLPGFASLFGGDQLFLSVGGTEAAARTAADARMSFRPCPSSPGCCARRPGMLFQRRNG